MELLVPVPHDATSMEKVMAASSKIVQQRIICLPVFTAKKDKAMRAEDLLCCKVMVKPILEADHAVSFQARFFHGKDAKQIL